jgi:cytochrome P450
VEERRREPRDDLVSRLVQVEREGDRLSAEECVHLVLDVMNGGIDTTQSQLAHGIRLFADEPDQWRLLREDPSLAPAAAEEVLRFEPVAPFTSRVLQEPVEFRGIEFPEGSVVFASAWNANREATGDEQPERFDITATRGSAKSLTFGAGPHFCLGSNLARAELQEGLAFLAREMPRLELAGEPRYGTITGLYGMESLPIRWASGPGA